MMSRPGPQIGALPVITRNANGFTLLETLLALLLFSLVLLMLYSGLFQAGNNWRMSETQLRKNNDKRFILSFLRRRIEQVRPIIQDQGGDTRIIFRGGKHELEFVSTLPSYATDNGLYFLKLDLQEDGLVLRFLPLSRHENMFAEDIFADARQIHLAQDVNQIDLEYFGRHGPDGEPAWEDAWNNVYWLPRLLRIRFETENHHSWPPLVIALRSQAEWRPPQLAIYLEEEA